MCHDPHLAEVEFLVSGFLEEVQLLVESPQKLHPLASCWGHCGHRASWTIMILMIMAKIMLSLNCGWWRGQGQGHLHLSLFIIYIYYYYCATWTSLLALVSELGRHPFLLSTITKGTRLGALKSSYVNISLFFRAFSIFLFTGPTQTYFAFKLMICSGVK